MKIKFTLGEFAKLPYHLDNGDAGYDVYYAGRNHVSIQPGARIKLDTNLSWEVVFDNLIEKILFKLLHMSIYAHICDRSGLALKKGITVLGGILDISFRGNIGVILLNVSQEVVVIKPEDRIAQLIFSTCLHPTSIIKVDELSKTSRGNGGFGSTGK